MIHLYYSNHLEALLEPLSAALSRRDPFHQPTISVPNPHLKQWLNLRLAARQGIAVHLRFLGLEALLAELLGGESIHLLPTWTLQMRLIEGMERCLTEDGPGTEPLRHFFGAHPTHAKLFQLSGRLAQLFREYGFSRMNMLRAWEAGEWYLDEQASAEAWQRALWLELLSGLDVREAAGQSEQARHLPLSAFPKPARTLKFGSVHLFGISYLSQQFQERLRQLAPHGDIHVYVLNPCRVYWEDVTSRRALDRQVPDRNADDAGLLENPFLQVWGRPGREYFKLLNELGDWDFYDAFEEPSDESRLLPRLQAEILDRLGPEAESEPLPADDSLRILACPSPRREAEIVANSIWNLMLDHPQLTWRDIAVIAVDMSVCQAEIESAFQRIRRIPYNMIDVVSGQSKSLLDAVQQLLELPAGVNQRDELFRLFLHPNFLAKFPEADPRTWLAWADRTGIFFGRDKRQQAEAGYDYFSDDVFHWEQGFRRLLLGPYVHERDRHRYRSGDQRYEVIPMAEEDAGEFRQFFAVVQSLFYHTNEGLTQPRSGRGWVDTIRGLITDFLAPAPLDGGDFESVLQLVDRLGDLDIGIPADQARFDFATVKAFLLEGLTQLRSFVGSYLTSGVTVSSLQPMRPIPFKVIFIMGLNETVFPRPNRRDTLDLRWFQPRQNNLREVYRQPGDVSDQEKDCYMFLETLVSTRERLILSYVDRDQRTQEPRFPSPVILEIESWLARTCPTFRQTEHPLKAYAPAYTFPSWSTQGTWRSHDPIAEGVARALTNPQSGAPVDEEQTGAAELKTEFHARGEPLLAERETQSETKRISLYQLRSFLECPLQASARMILGWGDDSGPAVEERGEPMHVGNLFRARQLQDFVDGFLQRGKREMDDEAEVILNEWSWRQRSRGAMPAGLPALAVQQQLRQVLQIWLAEASASLMGQYHGRLPLASPSRRSNEPSLPALEFTIELKGISHRVELVGRSQALFQDDLGWQSALFKTGQLKSSAKVKDPLLALPPIKPGHLVSGWIHAVVLAASGLGDHRAHVFSAKQDETNVCVAYRLSRAAARTYLEGLLTDLLSGPHDYLMPIEWVWQHVQRQGGFGTEPDFHALAQQALTKQPEEVNVSSRYGPVTRWWQYPPADQLPQRLERRFGPWLDQLADDAAWLTGTERGRSR